MHTTLTSSNSTYCTMSSRTFSFSFSSVEHLLLPASPAAAGNGPRSGHRRGNFMRPSAAAAAANTLLRRDFDLQEGLTDVQKILHQHQKGDREMMVTVDNLKRLCIDHYFQEEIESAISACMDLLHSHDLLDATLAFRLHHRCAADDVLWRFTDGAGEFKLSLSKDIRGLLSLHDLSHLDIGGEALLCKAKNFSRKHLASAVRCTSAEPGLARYVRQSLEHPYHLSLMQYKARHHLTYLQSLPARDTAVEKLAVAEFQLNKLLME